MTRLSTSFVRDRELICERYPEKWVVLVHIDWPNCRTAEFRSAVVVGHAATRDAALDGALPQPASVIVQTKSSP